MTRRGGARGGPWRAALPALLTLPAVPCVASASARQGVSDAAAASRGEIPQDKRLDPEWVRSLYARGEPSEVRGASLDTIGMPVGGLFAGQVYLGGDGRLWLWDVFNGTALGVCGAGCSGENYVSPRKPVFPFRQGFAVRVNEGGVWTTRPLDREGFPAVAFRGAYPVGTVRYEDPAFAVATTLEAFSPFVPLDVARSSYPAVVLRYTLRNRSRAPVSAEILGYLENPVALESETTEAVRFRNRVQAVPEGTVLTAGAAPRPEPTSPRRERIVLADFESGYGNWRVEGEAFGRDPAHGARGIQRLSGFEGKRLVNSWQDSDAATGKLTSPEFVVTRRFVNFLLGGGNHPDAIRVALLVNGAVVRSATGRDSDAMDWVSWDVQEFEGSTATIEILDAHSGPWGHVVADQFELDDERRRSKSLPILTERGDFGTAALLLASKVGVRVALGLPRDAPLSAMATALRGVEDQAHDADARSLGVLARTLVLAPGEETQVDFVLSWYFPNLRIAGFEGIVGRHYASRWSSALGVARNVAADLTALARETFLWRHTWYDSSLPYWFLDRTFVNVSTLATSTVHRFRDGRFWAWEGVGCCPGTCTHVWHYAWAVGRLFPEVERRLREEVDLGIAYDAETGGVGMRAEFDRTPAVDGQAGVVLRAYRDHLTSVDDAYLLRIWPRLKGAVEHLIRRDVDVDGILDGAQPNTLDAAWYGEIAWTSSLYLAALRAAEEMARLAGDPAFAKTCREIFERGSARIAERLFDGEVFVQRLDPEHADDIGTGSGCYVDQTIGACWARQLGLGPILDPVKVQTALRSLWKYNFAPDVGPFRAANPEGRPFAVAGEAGLVQCTWRDGERREAWKRHWQYGYFNECMTGFEHQAAAHMIWEGMLEEGLAVERAVHDRYHPAKRNPYNEIECADHYARAMASYGVFLAICGFEYDGPAGVMGFDPRLGADDFKAAFTAAEGWGSYAQTRSPSAQTAKLSVAHGRVVLREFRAALPGNARAARAQGSIDGREVKSFIEDAGPRARIRFPSPVVVEAGHTLDIRIDLAH